jgi:hypothetical protein
LKERSYILLGIRIPPSSRSTTPFNITFSIPCRTSAANSSGFPGRTEGVRRQHITSIIHIQTHNDLRERKEEGKGDGGSTSPSSAFSHPSISASLLDSSSLNNVDCDVERGGSVEGNSQGGRGETYEGTPLRASETHALYRTSWLSFLNRKARGRLLRRGCRGGRGRGLGGA